MDIPNQKKVLLGATAFCYEYRHELLRVIAAPLLLLLSIDLIAVYLFPEEGIIFSFLSAFISTLLAISIHRLLILGRGAVPKWGLFKVSSREVQFLVKTVVLGLLLVLPAMASFLASEYLAAFVFLIAVYVCTRFSLVFPSIATDKPLSFLESWELTKKHRMLMAITTVVVPIVLYVPIYLLAQLPLMEWPASVLSTVVVVFEVAALSAAYKVVMHDNTYLKEAAVD